MNGEKQPAWVLIWELELPRPEGLVMHALVRHGDADGKNIYPGMRQVGWECSYSPKQVRRIVDGLVAKGYLVLEATDYGEYGTNKYSINWEAIPRKKPLERKRNGRPMKKHGDISAELEDIQMSPPSLLEGAKLQDTQESPPSTQHGDITEKHGDISAQLGDIQMSTNLPGDQPEEPEKRDSNQLSPGGKLHEVRGGHAANGGHYSPYIASIITDFSGELGDQGHAVSNVSQALRLYRAAELDEAAFAELLFEARKTVRTYQGKQGLGTIHNKMAYFFQVLRNQLGKVSGRDAQLQGMQ